MRAVMGARPRVAVAALTTAAALAVGAPAQAARYPLPVVRAGALQVGVSNPWRLHFESAHADPVVTEAQGTGLTALGTLGFRRAGLWYHATAATPAGADGAGGLRLTVATSDPLGTTLAVTATPKGDGVIRVAAMPSSALGIDAMTVAFDSAANERMLGFGERSNAVDQRGGQVENYVAEGPYQDVENPFIAGFVPLPGFHPRHDATYFPVPWLLSSRGYGVLLDGNDTSRFELGTERADAWRIESDSARLSFRVFGGPRPADALRRFTAAVGRQPPAAAPFYFGPWWQPKGADTDNVKTLRRAGALGSVAQTYTHYLPCGDQQGAEAAQRERTTRLHAAGLAVTTYFNPMICTSYSPRYDQAAAKGLLTKNALGQPYEYRYTGSSLFLVGQFDFSNRQAGRFYGNLLNEAVRHGYDGWMEDFGEYTPTDAVSHDGTPGAQMHNLYPVLSRGPARRYARDRAPRPLARFNRSGWTGAARVSQIVWGGDPTTGFGFDGLASALRNGLTMGLSGVSLWGSDIGGFFALSEPQTTPDLLRRWIEFGFASGVMRTQANGFSLAPSTRAQIFDDDVLGVWRRYARLRTQFYPYLAAAEREYDRSGMPMMRHLALRYPNDPAATARDDEYLFGPDLLVAPVIAEGATRRSLYLPRGQWIDLWRSTTLDASTRLKLHAPTVLSGGATVDVPAPPAQLPLFVRAGALLALLPADVDTLSPYGSGTVHLGDRAGHRTLLAWPTPGRTGRAEPAAGESATSELLADRWILRLSGGPERRYDLQTVLPSEPCAVQVHDRPLAPGQWSWDPARHVLRLSFRIGEGAVVAHLRCAA